jgi:protein gp37
MTEIEFCHHWKIHPTWAWTGDYLSGLKDFRPTFLEAQFDKKFPQKTQKIFVGSMSEIYYWEDRWLEKVLEKVKLYPRHIFQFLTKFPAIYQSWVFPDNCWLGVTVTNNKECCYSNFKLRNNNIKFASIEPILEEINIALISYLNVDWLIIGAETGHRKEKIIPKKEWIRVIIDECRRYDIPVYLKDSLKNIYPDKIKMFPEVK